MPSPLPPLNWLRSFEASARHLSFTAAAAELHMTQSAVSQHIKALENGLGVALFHRRARALELTNAGITYLPVVRSAFHTIADGTRAVTGGGRGAVQVQCSLSFSIFWLAPRIGRFQAAYPGVRLNIATELWEAREMAEGADVEIRFSVRPSDQVRPELLCRNRYYPVAAPGYAVSLDELASHPLFDCINILGNWQGWAREAGLAWRDPCVTFATTYAFTFGAAEAGAGLALAPEILARPLLDRGRLIAPFEAVAEMPEAYYLICSPRAAGNPGAEAFAAWIKAEMRDCQVA